MAQSNSTPAAEMPAELSAEEIAAVSGGDGGLIGSSGKDGGGTLGSGT
ncbi:MAG TPA: hypothetical protein VGB79_02525 [Allosphingosinicella sp.]|jgi:hypothetical protein